MLLAGVARSTAPAARAPAPVANLGLVLATAALGSTGALVSLNIFQNGPERALDLDTIVGGKELTGDLFSGPFTPTDTAPTCLDEVLTLRCKSDVVRAWRNGKAPTSVPGGAEGGALELWDGALLRRGVLSPSSSFISHTLFGGGAGRWRGKAFGVVGAGVNRFGGARRNRFGVTRSDARDLERQLKDQIKERAAQFDPLLAEQLKSGGALVKGYGGGKAEAAGAEAAAGAGAGGDAGEVRARPFEARIEASRLDGRPALVLDYAAARRGGVADLLWGPLFGMRDELREVAPGVLVGLGSMRATGGVRNCAPFVLTRAED